MQLHPWLKSLPDPELHSLSPRPLHAELREGRREGLVVQLNPRLNGGYRKLWLLASVGGAHRDGDPPQLHVFWRQ